MVYWLNGAMQAHFLWVGITMSGDRSVFGWIVSVASPSLLCLPAYRSDLNPIEMAFAKLKAFLRHAGRRTFEGLHVATAQALETFSPTHCSNFFRHANYATY